MFFGYLHMHEQKHLLLILLYLVRILKYANMEMQSKRQKQSLSLKINILCDHLCSSTQSELLKSAFLSFLQVVFRNSSPDWLFEE